MWFYHKNYVERAEAGQLMTSGLSRPSYCLVFTLAVYVILAISILFLANTPSIRAAEIKLSWDDPNNNPSNVNAYTLYYWQPSWLIPASENAGLNLTHVLSNLNPGEMYEFAVTATVTDANGAQESAYSNIVTATLPVANFSTNADPNDPATITFTDGSNGMLTTWMWDFGDGSTSTQIHPIHTYAASGVYTVSLTVSGTEGSDTITDIVTVNVTSLAASLTAMPTSGLAPLTVDFTDASTGAITSWLWDFGDGVTSASQHPSHTYSEPGSYTVTLTVTGSGGSDTASASITAQAATLTADFTATPTSGLAPLTVDFTDASTGAVTSWLWDFGDGVTSASQHPSHTYSEPGSYTVTLTVTGSGGSDTASASITAQAATLTADFTATPTSGLAPLTVDFTDASTGAVTSWLWDFGDGVTSASQHPSHTYSEPGSYTVTLTVTGSGGSDTASASITAQAATLTADFTATPTSGLAPLTVDFTDASTGAVTSWLWDFGDGVTSASQHPSHTYSEPGSYTVTLTVTGPGGSAVFTAIDIITPTESMSSNEIHVADLDGYDIDNGEGWKAVVRITIHDTGHHVISGVQVHGIWGSRYKYYNSCITDGNGQCSLESQSINNWRREIDFTIDNLTHNTLIYKSDDNHDEDGGSDGNSITIQR